MAELETLTAGKDALRDATMADLTDMPKLETCQLSHSFKCVQVARLRNAGELEAIKELKDVADRMKKGGMTATFVLGEMERLEEEEEKREEMDANASRSLHIASMKDLESADRLVGTIVVDSDCCNSEELKSLDLTKLQNLRELHVGDDCFKHVETVVIDGLKYLESVVVGECSFRKEEMITNQPTCRSLRVINCASLKDLTIGAFSFSDYSTFEIDHVPSLESLEIGDLNEESYNFHNADLVLKSGFQRVE